MNKRKNLSETTTDYGLLLAFARNPDGSFLLTDAVRVKCPHHPVGYLLTQEQLNECPRCHGSRWKPTTDGDVMAQAVWPLIYRHTLHLSSPEYRDYMLARARGDSLAAWEAAWKALVAAGLVQEAMR